MKRMKRMSGFHIPVQRSQRTKSYKLYKFIWVVAMNHLEILLLSVFVPVMSVHLELGRCTDIRVSVGFT